MSPIQIAGATRVMKAPVDWDESANGKCKDLAIIDYDGVMYSFWRPSLRDRFRILFGKPVRLLICGSAHPPVAIDTDE